jgi:hypothetical protein
VFFRAVKCCHGTSPPLHYSFSSFFHSFATHAPSASAPVKTRHAGRSNRTARHARISISTTTPPDDPVRKINKPDDRSRRVHARRRTAIELCTARPVQNSDQLSE